MSGSALLKAAPSFLEREYEREGFLDNYSGPPAEVVMHSVGVAQEVVHCKN